LFLCSVNRLVEFIKYKWKASGRHGIHSPFIYDLIENGIRTSIIKAEFHPNDSKNIDFQKFVFKLIRYFKPQYILIDENKEITSWKNFFQENFMDLKVRLNTEEFNNSSNTDEFDIIFISEPTNLLEKVSRLIPYFGNDTILIVYGIRNNQLVFNEWRKLCEMKTFHVSIDFFQSGLIMKRNQQEKEHFTLKTP